MDMAVAASEPCHRLSSECFAGTGGAAGAVLALGDSLTAGYGLPQGEGFVPRLQAALAARGHRCG